MGLDLYVEKIPFGWHPEVIQSLRYAGFKHWIYTFNELTGEELQEYIGYIYNVNDIARLLNASKKFVNTNPNHENINDMKEIILFFEECIKHNISCIVG
jgi:hypothetical protein